MPRQTETRDNLSRDAEKPGLLYCKRHWSQLCLFILESGLSGLDFPLQTGAGALDSLVCKHLQLKGCCRLPLQPALPCLLTAFQPGRRSCCSLFTHTLLQERLFSLLELPDFHTATRSSTPSTLHATFHAPFHPFCIHWNMRGLLAAVILRQVQEAQLKPMAEVVPLPKMGKKQDQMNFGWNN